MLFEEQGDKVLGLEGGEGKECFRRPPPPARRGGYFTSFFFKIP